MNAKDASILAQVAGKIAAELFAGSKDVDGYLVAAKTIHDDLLERNELGVTVTEQQAVTNLQQGLGAQVVPQVQQPTAVQTPAPSPATFGGAPTSPQEREEALWKDLLENLDNWWDNRGEGNTTIAGGTRPDFRHKSLKDKNGKPVALYLVSRRFNRQAPDWVFQSLGIQVPGGAPAQQVTQPAPF